MGEMTTVSVTHSTMDRHARYLRSHGVPDATRIAQVDGTIVIDVPEAEFRVSLDSNAAGASTQFFAVFREDKPAGGTWWSRWTVLVETSASAHEIGVLIADQVHDSRRRFARILAEQR
ncbi:hypothetical protein [Amycolatopsis sp. EV170708-02-1]|uniref:hypothetical protein n=1 Tax=Amycolatopsis sp. EV170708-02-1 TaxID=2919322 RepID=UPI001F0BB5B7|nr:hypothetical protein [Amycolatopsis sp. EV170708-02-1]UMP00014.1 hypothetical protein MJQ72_26275 [Amycolatopsis sp. EV170708-02-1]